MATAYAFTVGDKVTLTNIATPVSEDSLVWNTGLSAADEPHADEEATLAGHAIITDAEAFVNKNIAQINLFRTNQTMLLAPGDSLEIAPTTAAEFLYYSGIKDALLSVVVTPAPAADGQE